MSLQLRLLGGIVALLFIALAAGASFLYVHDHALIEVEVRTAFNGSVQSVRDTLRSDVQHTVTLREVVSSFHGQRHVRTSLINEDGKVIVQSQLGRATDPAPAWFRRIMAPPILSARLPVGIAGYPCVLVLTSNPDNKIAEVWGHARDAFAVMLLFCVATLILVSMALASAMRFFRRLEAGLLSVSSGDYAQRLTGKQPPEFARLSHGFNSMAMELAALSGSNRQLYLQLQSVQEEERAEIARDLHDEVGPYLFTIQVDATEMRSLGTPTAERLGNSVRDAVTHIQEHVKSILRRLRPVSQLEFGLEAAIQDLVAFWMRRRPDIRFEQMIRLHGKLPRRCEEAAYRIVQESVSNAMRHGKPNTVRIEIHSQPDEMSIQIADDGGGMEAQPDKAAGLGGAGVSGMRARVQGLNGRFSVEECGGGVRVCAALPLRLEHEAA
jgi:two-component system sensor histidine kinase UhpB